MSASTILTIGQAVFFLLTVVGLSWHIGNLRARVAWLEKALSQHVDSSDTNWSTFDRHVTTTDKWIDMLRTDLHDTSEELRETRSIVDGMNE